MKTHRRFRKHLVQQPSNRKTHRIKTALLSRAQFESNCRGFWAN